MHLKEQSVKKQAISRYYFSIASIQSSKESSNYCIIKSFASFAGVMDTGDACRKVEYLREYLKKIKNVTRLVYWGQEKLFEEKNQR
jgi:hypothetical protein